MIPAMKWNLAILGALSTSTRVALADKPEPSGKPWIPSDTRCNPHDTSKIQVFKHGWYHAHDCSKPHSCIDISRTDYPGRAGCDNGDGTYDVPDPYNWEPDFTKRDAIDGTSDVIHFDSRCEPRGGNYVERFNGTNWVYEYSCPLSSPCIDLHGLGACQIGDGAFYVPAAARPKDDDSDSGSDRNSARKLRRRDDAPPNLHSWDTRCNPHNFTEIQRFDGTNWVLHFACPSDDSCMDVVGIGACYLGMNHYLTPAANDTINPVKPLAGVPMVPQTKCDPSNSSAVLGWTVTGWELAGECAERMTCLDFETHEFGENTAVNNFAVCANKEMGKGGNGPVWLPWTPGSLANPQTSSQIRCKNKRELIRLERDAGWILDRACSDGWKCSNGANPPHLGGCYTDSIAKLKVYQRAIGFDVLAPPPIFDEPPQLHRREITSSSDSSSDDEKSIPPIDAQIQYGSMPPRHVIDIEEH